MKKVIIKGLVLVLTICSFLTSSFEIVLADGKANVENNYFVSGGSNNPPTSENVCMDKPIKISGNYIEIPYYSGKYEYVSIIRDWSNWSVDGNIGNTDLSKYVSDVLFCNETQSRKEYRYERDVKTTKTTYTYYTDYSRVVYPIVIKNGKKTKAKYGITEYQTLSSDKNYPGAISGWTIVCTYKKAKTNTTVDHQVSNWMTSTSYPGWTLYDTRTTYRNRELLYHWNPEVSVSYKKYNTIYPVNPNSYSVITALHYDQALSKTGFRIASNTFDVYYMSSDQLFLRLIEEINKADGMSTIEDKDIFSRIILGYLSLIKNVFNGEIFGELFDFVEPICDVVIETPEKIRLANKAVITNMLAEVWRNSFYNKTFVISIEGNTMFESIINIGVIDKVDSISMIMNQNDFSKFNIKNSMYINRNAIGTVEYLDQKEALDCLTELATRFENASEFNQIGLK